jgi:hypothetical protein
MILTEKFLLPPNIDDAQRRAIVAKRMRRHRGASSHIIAIFPGEDGWVRQLGNEDGVVYFGIVERQYNSPSLPQQNHRRRGW